MRKSFDNEGMRNDDPQSRLGLDSWRDQNVEDPFDDPRVRQRISELIIRAIVKPPRLGG